MRTPKWTICSTISKLAIMDKLVDFLECSSFNGLRQGMSAPLNEGYKADLGISLLEEDFITQLDTTGIEVQDLNEIHFAEDGTLSFKNQRVLIYIRDINPTRNHFSMPKFHVSSCSTIIDMWSKKRDHRYVLYRGESGYFSLNIIKNNQVVSEQHKLDICKNCLSKLDWENFASETRSNKNKIVSNFSISKFFEIYPKSLLTVKPKYNSDTAPLNDYPLNWSEISDRVRENAGNQCFSCCVELINENRKYLHVHHIDGQKNNNKQHNLQVLCIKCHAGEPDHGHMKVSNDYREFILLYDNLLAQQKLGN